MGPPHSFIAHLHWHALAVFQVLILLLWTPSANGAVTNTTVDDTDSAFTFTGSWTAVSASDPCSFCSSKPDPTQTFDQTWHDGNYRTGASETTTGSFTFTGSAVYIYGIDQAKSQPDIAFTLGSTQAVHHYTGTEQFVYNALFFSATGLADETHTVNWIFNIDPSTGVGVQEALFDYAIVTSGTDNAPDPNPTDNTPIIITTTTQQTTSPTKPSTQTLPSSSTASSPSTANKLVSSPSAVGKPSSTSVISSASDFHDRLTLPLQLHRSTGRNLSFINCRVRVRCPPQFTLR
ncbi:hypothetical protein B0H11DRAFT_626052 [Mycena galericulata]|nr:hypothetical protein B0H11DRAFT_626052 [Mycena galericulata]